MEGADGFSDRVYIIALRIIQPARVQDIYNSLEHIFGDDIYKKITEEAIYTSHSQMKKSGLIISVRKGTYCLDNRTWNHARTLLKYYKLDNRRFFLMKTERKRYRS